MNLSTLFHNVAHAFKQNLRAGLVLQAIAIFLGVAYYTIPALSPMFDFFAGLKGRYGIWYAIVATSIFGGVIPFLILKAAGQIRKQALGQLLFYTLFWAIKGAEVDLFYRMQGLIFGTSNDWQTVITKTLFDQLLYASLWMVPTISLAYLWKECGFSFNLLRKKVDRGFITMTIPTIVVSNWLVWLPAIVVVYSMPPDLQVPLYNLVQCFFVLILAILARPSDDD